MLIVGVALYAKKGGTLKIQRLTTFIFAEAVENRDLGGQALLDSFLEGERKEGSSGIAILNHRKKLLLIIHMVISDRETFL